MRRKLFAEWSLMCLATCALAILVIATPLGQRADNFLYDLASRSTVSTASAPDSTLIVAIDNQSIDALGPWPWPRATLARLIDNTARSNPRTIILDVLLTESRPGDAALAESIRRAGNVLLPIGVESPGKDGAAYDMVEPVPQLARAALATGHASVMPERDGIVRSVEQSIGPVASPLPHIALVAARIGAPAVSGSATPLDDDRRRLRFSVRAGGFNTVPAVAVLRGEVPAQFIAGRDVLIGSIGSGLGDTHATPLGSDGQNLAGVELLANALIADRANDWISLPGRGLVAAVTIAGLLLVCLLLLRLGPTGIVVASAALVMIIAVAAMLALSRGVWIVPTPAMIAIGFAATVWTWRRLASAETAIGAGLRQLGGVTPAVAATPSALFADPLSERIALLQSGLLAIRQSELALNRLLDAVPGPTFRVDPTGQITLANSAFWRLFGELGVPAPSQADALGRALEGDRHTDDGAEGPLRVSDGELQIVRHEVRDLMGRWYIVAAENLVEPAGWVVSMSDVSQVRQVTLAQRRSLQFLSHDLRAPIAASISLIDRAAAALPGTALYDARARLIDALQMADDHVALTKAEERRPVDAVFDLAICTEEAIDRMALRAADRGIAISEPDHDNAPLMAVGDHREISRAIANLIWNAINHGSRSGGAVAVTLRKADQMVEVIVADGDAASAEGLRDTLTSLSRSGAMPSGSGLGLAYCVTVVNKAGGTIDVAHTANGKAVTLSLRSAPGDMGALVAHDD